MMFAPWQQWEGTVVGVGPDSFTAILKDRLNLEAPEESVDIFLEDVSEADLKLVAPGALFYWSIGYEDTDRGRENKSIIKFRQPEQPEEP